MTRADLRADRRTRWAAITITVLFHVALVAGLVRAFTPNLAANVVSAVSRTFTVNLSPEPPPSPKPASTPQPADAPSERAGAAGAADKKSVPREVAAPAARIVVAPSRAPPVAGEGDENASGGSDRGGGTGVSGIGRGQGQGVSGDGAGGGGSARPTVKIAGEISSAKDYPRASRKLRIGASVIIDLTIGTDGSVKRCRVVQPSPDPEADRITCALATKRFQFDPATDETGRAITATYRWRQRWFH